MNKRILFTVLCISCFSCNININAYDQITLEKAKILSHKNNIYHGGQGEQPTRAERYLSYANLTGASLLGANLHEADLTNASLSGANLSSAILWNAVLFNANLTGCNLTGADLRGAKLNGANLTEADLTYADLTEVSLNGANLIGADLSDSIGLTNTQKAYARAHGAINVPADQPMESN